METNNTPTKKTCTTCLIEKPFSAFYRDRANKDGLVGRCRECVSAQRAGRRAQYQGRADHEIETPTEKRCWDCGKTKPASEYYKKRSNLDGLVDQCKSCFRWEKVQSRYGLSRDGWEAMWEAQEGRCSICQGPMERDGTAHGPLRAVVDHHPQRSGPGCHRALLHSICNRALGHFLDSPAVLRRAARYLELGADGPVDIARLDADNPLP